MVEGKNTFVFRRLLECYETAMLLMGDDHLLVAMAESVLRYPSMGEFLDINVLEDNRISEGLFLRIPSSLE